MRNSLRERGFAILDADWYRKSWCHAHQQPLYVLDAIDRKDAIASLGDIFSGEHSHNSQRLSPDHSMEHENTLKPGKGRAKEAYLAECAMRIINTFVISNIRRLPEEVSRLTSAHIILKCHHFGESIGRNGLHALYRKLTDTNVCGFNWMWSSRVIEATVACGIFDKETFIEPILKDRELACEECQLSCTYRGRVMAPDNFPVVLSNHAVSAIIDESN